MVAASNLVEVAALVGDTARATMLAALMDGQSLTGRELAHLARISPSTASEHLTKLVAARLLSVTSKRRFHYYRIASPLVAGMLESIKAVAAIEVPPRHQPHSKAQDAERFARTCYDHLAGRLGVALADALVAKGHLVLGEDGGTVTKKGRTFLGGFGVDLNPMSGKRIFCRACLDWSERRHHIAGVLGAALLARCLQLGWIERVRGSRAIKVTAAGHAGLRDTFDIDLESKAVAPRTRDRAAPVAVRARR